MHGFCIAKCTSHRRGLQPIFILQEQSNRDNSYTYDPLQQSHGVSKDICQQKNYTKVFQRAKAGQQTKNNEQQSSMQGLTGGDIEGLLATELPLFAGISAGES